MKKLPVEAVIFDCDGTLSQIEGIDYLAEQSGVGETVRQLTADAMGKTGINPDIYRQRLQLVRPTETQIKQLGDDYFTHRVADIFPVINLLTRFNKSVYIVSAGLFPSVAKFAERLHIPQQHVFAVNIQFDAQGNYLDYDHASPLVNNDGKRIVVQELKKKFSQLVYVGDGLNDLAVMDLVTHFIGYGGVFYREQIESRCQYYLKTVSMSALLPLILTEHEVTQLTPAEYQLYSQTQ